MLFNRNLDIISEVAEKECGFNLKSWNKYERREVIRELFRIRATNRLLSEINREFRENFLQLMSSYNERDMQMESQDIGLLYRKI